MRLILVGDRLVGVGRRLIRIRMLQPVSRERDFVHSTVIAHRKSDPGVRFPAEGGHGETRHSNQALVTPGPQRL
jgi:hypothetical protein